MNLATTTLQANLTSAGLSLFRIVPGPLADQQAVAVALWTRSIPRSMDGQAFFSPEPTPSDAILRAGWGEDAYKPETLEEIQRQARALFNAPWGNLSSDAIGKRKMRRSYRAIILEERAAAKEQANLVAGFSAVLFSAQFDSVGALWMETDPTGVSGKLKARPTSQALIKGLRDFWEQKGVLGDPGPAHVVLSVATRDNYEVLSAAL
jgi:hypothetical protein